MCVYVHACMGVCMCVCVCVQVFQGSDSELQDMYENHQQLVKEKERRLVEQEKELHRAGRECQRLTNAKSELLVEQGTATLPRVSHVG